MTKDFTIDSAESLYHEAFAKWGARAQITKACEELAELQVQLCKFLNGSPQEHEDIIDEIADVLVVANQMRLHFGSDDVLNRMAFKLERLEKALAK